MLAAITKDEVSREAFSYLTARDITIGYVPVRACASPTSASWAGSCTRKVVGRVTGGGFGWAVGLSIAYAYLPPSVAVGTAVEVEVFGRWVGACVTAEPLWDPKGDSIRG